MFDRARPVDFRQNGSSYVPIGLMRRVVVVVGFRELFKKGGFPQGSNQDKRRTMDGKLLTR